MPHTTNYRNLLIHAAVQDGKIPDLPEQIAYLKGRFDAAPATTERLLRDGAPRFVNVNASIAERRRPTSRAATPAVEVEQGTGLFPQLEDRDRSASVAASAEPGTGWIDHLLAEHPANKATCFSTRRSRRSETAGASWLRRW